MFAALARLVCARPRAWLAGYALVLAVAGVLALQVMPLLKAGGFEDPTRESWHAFSIMQNEMRAGMGDILALYSTPQGTIEDPEVMGAVLEVITRIEKDPSINTVFSYWSTGAPYLLSKDRTQTFLVIDLVGDEQAKTEALRRLTPQLQAEGLTLDIGGLIPTNLAVYDTIRRDLTRAELIAFPLTALVVLFVFGSVASVLVLVVAGGVSIALAFAALRVIAAFTDVSMFAVNTVSILGLGLAVDYSLFLVNRFREELPQHGVAGALERTLTTTGRAVMFSGVTVAASLCGLLVFPQMMLRSLAMGGIAVVLLTVVLSLTLVPALLAALGPRIDAGRIPVLHRAATLDDGGRNLWYRTALRVMKRPVLVAGLVSAGLLALALPFLRFEGSIGDARILPKDASVRVAHAKLDAAFFKNQQMPHLVLVTLPHDVLTREGLEKLAKLHQRFTQIPGVTRVDSVFSAVAGAPVERVIDGLLTRDKNDKDAERLLSTFATGPWMRFSILSEHAYDDPQTLAQAAALRALSTPEMKVEVAGYAAALIDLRDAVRERGPKMVGLVMSLMLVILFLVFGSITLPLKAMVMNALSLTASFGAIVWIFQDGRFAGLLNYEPLGFSDTTQPLVMFATVFGLSMDYEVLILSRVREEYLKSGDNTHAVAEGLGRTGRLITSAAALLVVVVGAFSTSQVLFAKTIGVGMALAIALDATIVRALLVPATMRLMGSWNWYAPAFLVRAWKKTGLSDLSH